MTDSLAIICTLIRRRVWGSKDPVPEGIDWNAVLLESARNGVSAICCEAASALPSSFGPDFQTLLTWDLSVRVLKDGFRKRHEATQDMRALLESNGMRMLLLKGESFASVYPEPSLRECGDVDFMVFDRYADFLSLSERLGIKLDDSQGKHSEFEYEGVVFECHTHVPDRKFNLCDYRTRTLVRDSFDKAVLRDDGCWELDPVVQAVFSVKHTAQHICYSGGRAIVRMLLDLALYLQKHKDVPGMWDEALEYTGLAEFAETELCVIRKLFGVDFSRSGKGWSRRTERRAERFIGLFLVDDVCLGYRYFAKFAFLPLSAPEVLRIIGGKLSGRRGK